MDNLNQINENNLAAALEQWAKETNLTKTHLWERNPVGKQIKQIVNSIGKWKYRARGNPRKGYLRMLENRNNTY